MYRGNPAGTGAMRGPGPVGQPRLLWRFRVDGDEFSSPVVANGIVYVGAESLFALDAMSGQQIWRNDRSLSSYSAAAIDGDLVLVNDVGPDAIVALDARTGAERWSHGFNWFISGVPIVADEVVYAGSGKSSNSVCIGICGSPSFEAISATNGVAEWTVEGSACAAPAVAGRTLWHVYSSGRLIARDTAAGAEQWSFALQDPCGASPAFAEGVIFIADSVNVHAVDAETGSERWRFVADARILSSPAVANGLVFFGTDGKNVHAVDAVTGQERWRFIAAATVESSAAVVDGIICVGSSDGTIYALDAATGSQLWTFRVEGSVWGSLAVANGIVYVGGRDGFLYAIGGDEGPTPATPAATILPIEEGATVEVNADGVVLRGAPSPTAVEIAELPKGTRLTVLGSREEREGTVWWRVQVIETGATGFVEEKYLTVVAEPT
jgi:outer membrane protein assembly factor BamB